MRRACKRIEDIQIGDRVWSWDEGARGFVPRRVVRLFRTARQPILELRCVTGGGNAQRIRGTPDHPFWVEGKGWTPLKKLVRGDALKCIDAERESYVLEVADTGSTEDVFNFEVEHAHNYVVGDCGVLVHNVSVLQSALGAADAAAGALLGVSPSEVAANVVQPRMAPPAVEGLKRVQAEGEGCAAIAAALAAEGVTPPTHQLPHGSNRYPFIPPGYQGHYTPEMRMHIAAYDGLANVIHASIRENREYGFWVYCQPKDDSFGATAPTYGKAGVFSPEPPSDGVLLSMNIGKPWKTVPAGTIPVASVHSHGSLDPYRHNKAGGFSRTDRKADRDDGVSGYLGTELGQFLFHAADFGEGSQPAETIYLGQFPETLQPDLRRARPDSVHSAAKRASEVEYVDIGHQLPPARLISVNGKSYPDLRDRFASSVVLRMDGTGEFTPVEAVEYGNRAEVMPIYEMIDRSMGLLPSKGVPADYVGPTPELNAVVGTFFKDPDGLTVRDAILVAQNQQQRQHFGISGIVLGANLMQLAADRNGGRYPDLEGDFFRSLGAISGTNYRVYMEARAGGASVGESISATPADKVLRRAGYTLIKEGVELPSEGVVRGLRWRYYGQSAATEAVSHPVEAAPPAHDAAASPWPWGAASEMPVFEALPGFSDAHPIGRGISNISQVTNESASGGDWAVSAATAYALLDAYVLPVDHRIEITPELDGPLRAPFSREYLDLVERWKAALPMPSRQLGEVIGSGGYANAFQWRFDPSKVLKVPRESSFAETEVNPRMVWQEAHEVISTQRLSLAGVQAIPMYGLIKYADAGGVKSALMSGRIYNMINLRDKVIAPMERARMAGGAVWSMVPDRYLNAFSSTTVDRLDTAIEVSMARGFRRLDGQDFMSLDNGDLWAGDVNGLIPWAGTYRDAKGFSDTEIRFRNDVARLIGIPERPAPPMDFLQAIRFRRWW